MKLRVSLILAAALTMLGAAALHAQQPGPAAGETFQKLLLVPPDDKDYIVVKVPAGSKAVVTDVVAYNTADGKGHKVSADAESYLWLGGYADGKASGVVNRMRILGNDTQQWHMHTGFELKGAPELLVTSEKGAPHESPVLVYVNGYIAK